MFEWKIKLEISLYIKIKVVNQFVTSEGDIKRMKVSFRWLDNFEMDEGAAVISEVLEESFWLRRILCWEMIKNDGKYNVIVETE